MKGLNEFHFFHFIFDFPTICTSQNFSKELYFGFQVPAASANNRDSTDNLKKGTILATGNCKHAKT